MTKKLVSLFLTLVLVMALPVFCTLAVGAEGAAEIVLDGQTYEVPRGETFVFETRVTMPQRAAAGGIVKLQFDKDVLELVRNENGSIYETDLEDVLTVGDYTADGKGCSFAFASTQYSDKAVLSGDKNLLVRFLFRVKNAEKTEIVFLQDQYDFSVFVSEDDMTPVDVVYSGKTTENADGYTFVGNTITVRKIENYQEYGEQTGNSEETSTTVSDNQQGTDASGNEGASEPENTSGDSNSSGTERTDDGQNPTGNPLISFTGIIAIIIVAVILVAAAIIGVCIAVNKKK